MKQPKLPIARFSTHFLRLTMLGLAMAVALLCYLMVPAIYKGWGDVFPDASWLTWPIMIGIVGSAVAVYVGLIAGWKILKYIDTATVFSEPTVHALAHIKYCGVVVGGIYFMGLPTIYMLANITDAPGIMVIGLIFMMTPIIVATFAGIMQGLVRSAITIKTENELTV